MTENQKTWGKKCPSTTHPQVSHGLARDETEPPT
jgi:hypothetical protein